MKIKTVAVAAGVSAPLILTGSASGGFVGITTTSKPNPFGLLTVNLYAVFDRPGEDHMISVAGTSQNPLIISAVDGTLFQHQFGKDRAPNPVLIDLFPSLAFDSFVTIGVKSFNPQDPGNGGQPEDNMILTCTWPGFSGGMLEMSTDGWAVLPSDAQGDPFNPDFIAGDGRVLIGQFSTADGTAISGTFRIDYISNNIQGFQIVSFFAVPTPGALAMMGMMGVAGLFGTRRRRRHRRDR